MALSDSPVSRAIACGDFPFTQLYTTAAGTESIARAITSLATGSPFRTLDNSSSNRGISASLFIFLPHQAVSPSTVGPSARQEIIGYYNASEDAILVLDWSLLWVQLKVGLWE